MNVQFLKKVNFGFTFWYRNLVQTSRCVHIHYVQTRHCVHIHYVQTSTFLFLYPWTWICTLGNLAVFDPFRTLKCLISLILRTPILVCNIVFGICGSGGFFIPQNKQNRRWSKCAEIFIAIRALHHPCIHRFVCICNCNCNCICICMCCGTCILNVHSKNGLWGAILLLQQLIIVSRGKEITKNSFCLGRPAWKHL